ncbi:MAG TPA: peptidylprolyl isomerase [Acidimicrobiales bacterium]|nr:peptidylprolyl isomerase [Acidimicrobiales bacterium]
MPTAKRQRQKEGRRARLEAARKHEQRRRLVRRSVIVLVVAVAVTLSVFKLTSGGGTPGTTTTTVPGTTAADVAAQKAANTLAVTAGCSKLPPPLGAAANKLTWKKPPKFTLDRHRRYYMTVGTTQGSFEVLLNVKHAPVNVNSLVFLARHHYFNCNPFPRVIPGFMDQTGDPTGTTSGSPGYVVPTNEFPKAGTAAAKYPVGTVAMAHAGNTCATSKPSQCAPGNGGQFFIVAGAQAATLPPEYTVVGTVVRGLGVVERINKTGRIDNPQTGQSQLPYVINRILSVTVYP